MTGARIALAAALWLAPPALAAQVARDTLSPVERAAMARLRQATIRDVTTHLAAPAMEGRGTAQAGGARAASYIADRFRQLGLTPLGDSGTFEQKVRFTATQVLPATRIVVPTGSLAYGDDFVTPTRLTADSIDLTGRLVFVGYGVVAPRFQRDDLAGIDLQGKIAVVLRGRPTGVDPGAWDTASSTGIVLGRLLQHGAVAVLMANTGSAAQPYSLIESYLVRRTVTLADAAPPSSTAPYIMLLSDAGAGRLWAPSGTTYSAAKARAESGAFASADLGASATIRLRARIITNTGSNVAGVLEGGDSAAKGEALVFSAHYDAYGVDAGGRVYPGAADNALGVGMMLGVAEALSKGTPRPRRSTVFLAVTGEEYGELGSGYWVEHPGWAITRTAANINFDGIGTEVYGPVRQVVGWGAEYSSLGPELAEAIAATGFRPAADPFPEEGVFYRSDHYNFVRQGVPAVMLLGAPDGSGWIDRARRWIGPAGPYHQPGDSVRTDWDWTGPTSLASVALVLGLRVLDDPQMPAWLPTSPFNNPRGGRRAGR